MSELGHLRPNRSINQGSAGMSDHARNTEAMLASRRCGAKTRSGGACRAPAVRGKKRCRMHGGAPGSGAPSENRNARKHGLFTGDAIAERRQIRALLGEARKLLQAMK
jgi:hypothetical protein